MTEHLVLSAPLFVSVFWSLCLWLDLMNRHERITLRLLLFMITTAGLYLCHFIYFSLSGHTPWTVDLLYRYCHLTVFPLWYFYMCELTLNRLSRKELFIWIAPAILLAPLSLIWEGALVIIKIVFALQVVSVLILGWHMLRNYEVLVASSYADTEPYSLHALRNLFIFLFLTTLASFTANLVGRERFLSSVALLTIPSMLFSAFIFMLGYESTHLLHKETAVQDEAYKADFSLGNGREQNGGLQPKDEENEEKHIAQLLCDVLKAMDEEKLYLQPNLKISDLSLHLGSNRNYIWRAVNAGLGVSFSELVNRRRIEHFINLAKQNELRDVNDMWQKCGFTSASSFYRNFKLYMGCTPAEYFARTT